jgi:hypothetical protein
MKRAFLACCVVATWLAAGEKASAQYDPYNRPTVSPYLNLLQTNRFGVTNYQSLVRPMIEQQQLNVQQQTNISALQQQFQASSMATGRADALGGMRNTGHPTRHFNYLHYYQQLNVLNQRFAR